MSEAIDMDTWHDNQLSNPVASRDCVGTLRMVIHENDFHFAAIATVDYPWAIQDGDPMSNGQSAARHNQSDMTIRDGDFQPGRNDRHASCGRNSDIDAGWQV